MFIDSRIEYRNFVSVSFSFLCKNQINNSVLSQEQQFQEESGHE